MKNYNLTLSCSRFKGIFSHRRIHWKNKACLLSIMRFSIVEPILVLLPTLPKSNLHLGMRLYLVDDFSRLPNGINVFSAPPPLPPLPDQDIGKRKFGLKFSRCTKVDRKIAKFYSILKKKTMNRNRVD